jgi:hypothetical protein
MASALVELAAGTVDFSGVPERVQAAARDAWGSLLDASPKNPPGDDHPRPRT